MGTAWSSWLEREHTFDKRRYANSEEQRAFYAALARAVAVIELAVEEEQAGVLGANATEDDEEDRHKQLQYMLENWAREAGSLYDRVGDFPLILPMPNELSAQSNLQAIHPAADPEAPPRSQDELLLKAACSNRFSTTDELHEAIKRIVEKLPEGALPYVLSKYPRAMRLFVALAVQVQQDVETPFRLLDSSLQSAKAASLVGILAYGEDSFVKKRSRLQEMVTLLNRVEMDPNATPQERLDASFNKTMTEETISLLDVQNRLENRLGVMHLVGSSVVETIQKLLALFPVHPSALSAAATVASDFNIHPTQFWWSLLRILAQNDEWHTLFLLSATVPPSFGFVPIAEALVEAERADLAPDLLAIIMQPDERDNVVRIFAASHQAADDAES